MRFFITDGQLAALRLEVATAAAVQHQADLAMRDIAQDRMLERVQTDHAATLARVTDASAPFVEHLRAEVAFWRLQYAHERQRAEVSIDQRLAERGLGPVTLPPRDGPEGADIDALIKSAEFAAMGSIDGVEQ